MDLHFTIIAEEKKFSSRNTPLNDKELGCPCQSTLSGASNIGKRHNLVMGSHIDTHRGVYAYVVFPRKFLYCLD